MLKPYKHLILAISMMIASSLAFAACTGTQPAAQVSTAPTKAAVTVVAAQPTPTTVQPTSTSAPATATPVATKVVTLAPTEVITKPTPVAVKVTPTEVRTKSTPAAVKPAPAAVKPAAAATAEVMLMTKKTTRGDILTDQKDMTLYTFKNDKPNESTCYDACAKEWEPVVVASENVKPMLSHGLTGKIDVIERKDGAYQITYNEMPLYHYAKDTKPGDSKGDGLNGLWHVVIEKSK